MENRKPNIDVFVRTPCTIIARFSKVNSRDISLILTDCLTHHFRDDRRWIGHWRYEVWSLITACLSHLSISARSLPRFTKLPADPRPRHLTTILSFRRLHSILREHLIASLINQRLVALSLSLAINTSANNSWSDHAWSLVLIDRHQFM